MNNLTVTLRHFNPYLDDS